MLRVASRPGKLIVAKHGSLDQAQATRAQEPQRSDDRLIETALGVEPSLATPCGAFHRQ